MVLLMCGRTYSRWPRSFFTIHDEFLSLSYVFPCTDILGDWDSVGDISPLFYKHSDGSMLSSMLGWALVSNNHHPPLQALPHIFWSYNAPQHYQGTLSNWVIGILTDCWCFFITEIATELIVSHSLPPPSVVKVWFHPIFSKICGLWIQPKFSSVLKAECWTEPPWTWSGCPVCIKNRFKLQTCSKIGKNNLKQLKLIACTTVCQMPWTSTRGTDQ